MSVCSLLNRDANRPRVCLFCLLSKPVKYGTVTSVNPAIAGTAVTHGRAAAAAAVQAACMVTTALARSLLDVVEFNASHFNQQSSVLVVADLAHDCRAYMAACNTAITENMAKGDMRDVTHAVLTK